VSIARCVAPRLATPLAGRVGLVGVVAALALPFAPVIAEQATVTWPVPGQPVESSMALLVQYRPAELTATVPCSAVRTATDRGTGVTILVIGPNRDGAADADRRRGARVLVDDEVVAVADRRVTGCQRTGRPGATLMGLRC
jgi:arabinosyltransferase B